MVTERKNSETEGGMIPQSFSQRGRFVVFPWAGRSPAWVSKELLEVWLAIPTIFYLLNLQHDVRKHRKCNERHISQT